MLCPLMCSCFVALEGSCNKAMLSGPCPACVDSPRVPGLLVRTDSLPQGADDSDSAPPGFESQSNGFLSPGVIRNLLPQSAGQSC